MPLEREIRPDHHPVTRQGLVLRHSAAQLHMARVFGLGMVE